MSTALHRLQASNSRSQSYDYLRLIGNHIAWPVYLLSESLVAWAGGYEAGWVAAGG